MRKMIKTIVTIALAISLCIGFAWAEGEPSDWAKSSINRAVSLGLIPQEMQTNYQDDIKRVDFCKMIVSLIEAWDMDTQQLLSNRDLNQFMFTDTSDLNVKFCVAMGIVSGRGDGRFDPYADVTRQEAAKMVYQVAKNILPELNKIRNDSHTVAEEDDISIALPHVFSDGFELESWAREAVAYAYRNGIMGTTSGNNFSPNRNLTREQAYITILRLYNIVENQKENNRPKSELYPFSQLDQTGQIKMGYLNEEGTPVIAPKFLEAEPFDGEYARVRLGKNQYGIINKSGVLLLQGFGTNGVFKNININGILASVQTEAYEINATVRLTDGKILGVYQENLELSNGMLAVQTEDGIYGYVNENGDYVIRPQF